MSREDKHAHREAVDAYYRQNGMQPPRHPISDALDRFRARNEQARGSGRKLPPAQPPDPSRLSPGGQSLVDFVAREKPHFDTLRANREQQLAEEATQRRADQEHEARNEAARRRDNPDVAQPKTPPRKGSTVSHNDDTVTHLVDARGHVETASATANQMLELIGTAARYLVHADNEITTAAGSANMAVGAMGYGATLAQHLVALGTDRDDVRAALAQARTAIEAYIRHTGVVQGAFDDAIRHFQAQG